MLTILRVFFSLFVCSIFIVVRSVEVLTTEWREGRDRLVLDYKRKRKDVCILFSVCRHFYCVVFFNGSLDLCKKMCSC